MRKSLILAAMILLPLTAKADTLPRPTASYDADVTSDIGSHHATARINAAGPRLRVATTLPSGPVTVLIDRATDQVHMLVMNTSVPVDKKMMGGYDLNMLNTIELDPEAADSVNGVPATRYAVTTQIKNDRFDGHIWATPDGAVLEIDGIDTKPTDSVPVRIVLSNFQRRPQNPAQFIAPPTPAGLAGLLGAIKNSK